MPADGLSRGVVAAFRVQAAGTKAVLSSLSSVYQSKTARTIAIVATSNTATMLLTMAGSLVQARYVGPTEMGVLRTFSIVSGYLAFLLMGVDNGLQREIPLRLGRAEPGKANRAASACLAWIQFVSVVCGVSFCGLALRAAYYGQWLQVWGWLAYTPGIIAAFYGSYLNTTFRTGEQFVKLSKALAVGAIAGTVVLPTLPAMGYYGACLRTAAMSLASLFCLHRWRPMRVRARLDWPAFWQVIRIGLPISTIGYLGTAFWASLEGTLVLAWFGTQALGLFAMAVFIRSVAGQFTHNMNQVLAVRVFQEYGRSGRVGDCRALISKPLTLALSASLPMIIIGWFALPRLIVVFVPKYVDAITMMRAMLLTVPISFLNLRMSVLQATGRRVEYLIAVMGGLVMFIGLSYLLYRLRIGILSVVIASILGQGMNVVVAQVLILRLARREERTVTTCVV